MARPTKQGLDYFPFDVGFFGDKNVRILKARYRADGIAVYVKLLCDVYKEGYFLPVVDWDDYIFVIADEFGISTDKVEQVIAFLQSHAMVRVFNKEDELTGLDVDAVITSHGIQKRYATAMKSRRKKSVDEIKRGFWILSKEEEDEISAFYKSGINDSLSEKNTDKSEKNKTKEKKVRTSTTRTCTCTDEDVHVQNEEGKEISEEKRKFFYTYPKMWNTSHGVDDSEIDYKKLLHFFELSKKCLQSRESFAWVASNYLKILTGFYNDYPGIEKTKDAQGLPPIIQAINDRADRERFYARRREKVEREKDRAYQKALKSSVEFACAEQEIRKMQLEIAKAELNDVDLARELKEKEEALKRARIYALKKIGLTLEDIEGKPYCSKCADTGTLPNGRACDCYRREYMEELK